MSTLATINAHVDKIIQDDAGWLDSTEIDAFIQNEALGIYSKDRPYETISDISASSVYDYEINNTNFPSWSDGFSSIIDVYYPAGESQDPEDDRIPREDWVIYKTSSAKYLRFTANTPSSGYTIRAIYTIPHLVTTVYANDFGAVCQLVASYCCFALANKYVQTSESTIGADAVAYRDKSDVYASRAKNCLQNYINHFEGKTEASGALKEFDTTYPHGESRLTHLSWQR